MTFPFYCFWYLQSKGIESEINSRLRLKTSTHLSQPPSFSKILYLFLCTYYSVWMSCLISFVWDSPSYDEWGKFKMKRDCKHLTKWQHSEECMCGLRIIAMRDYQESVTTEQTHRQTHGQTDRQTSDKVIPMCRYASQATQKPDAQATLTLHPTIFSAFGLKQDNTLQKAWIYLTCILLRKHHFLLKDSTVAKKMETSTYWHVNAKILWFLCISKQ